MTLQICIYNINILYIYIYICNHRRLTNKIKTKSHNPRLSYVAFLPLHYVQIRFRLTIPCRVIQLPSLTYRDLSNFITAYCTMVVTVTVWYLQGFRERDVTQGSKCDIGFSIFSIFPDIFCWETIFPGLIQCAKMISFRSYIA